MTYKIFLGCVCVNILRAYSQIYNFDYDYEAKILYLVLYNVGARIGVRISECYTVDISLRFMYVFILKQRTVYFRFVCKSF